MRVVSEIQSHCKAHDPLSTESQLLDVHKSHRPAHVLLTSHVPLYSEAAFESV